MAGGGLNGAYEAQQAPDELWSLKQVTSYMGISLDYGRHIWPTWVEHGVNPVRLHGKPKGALRFYRSEIEGLLERWRVEQKASRKT